MFARAACASEGGMCLILLDVCSQFLSRMCQEENVFITEYVGDTQIQDALQWSEASVCVCVCVLLH